MKMMIPLLLLATNAHAKVCFREIVNLKDQEFQVKLSHYGTRTQKNIIIIPPTGGINLIDRSFARNFCQAGFNAWVLEHWTGDDELKLDFGVHNRFYANVQRAIELTIKNIPEKEFIGILGTSVGGMHAATATGRFERIKAAFIITGGADIAGIIVNSQQQAMIDAKAKRYQMFNFKNDLDYETQLRPHIHLDAVHFTGHQGKHLGMAIGTQDTVLPVKNQLVLKDLWKPKKVIELNNDHFWSILKSWLFHQKEIIRFFQDSSL